jgi:hypothetical protein
MTSRERGTIALDRRHGARYGRPVAMLKPAFTAPEMPTPKASLTVDRPIAILIRKACRRERIDLSTFLLTLLREYARLYHPEWELDEPTRPHRGIIAIGDTEDFQNRPRQKGPTFGLARRITRADVESYEGYTPNPSKRGSRDNERSVKEPDPGQPKARLGGGPRIVGVVPPGPGQPKARLGGGPRIVGVVLPGPVRGRA